MNYGYMVNIKLIKTQIFDRKNINFSNIWLHNRFYVCQCFAC